VRISVALAPADDKILSYKARIARTLTDAIYALLGQLETIGLAELEWLNTRWRTHFPAVAENPSCQVSALAVLSLGAPDRGGDPNPDDACGPLSQVVTLGLQNRTSAPR
jgi:hypothetical protein